MLGRSFFYSLDDPEQSMRTREGSVFTLSTSEGRALWISTAAFTACFAVWTIFAIIGIRIKAQLGLTETEFGLLVGTPILTGSLARIFLGVWTDRYGGRLIFTLNMLAASVATALLVFAQTYPQMLRRGTRCGLGGRLVCSRNRLRLALLPIGTARHRARNFRCRKCRCGGHEVLLLRSCLLLGVGTPWL